MKTKNQNKGKNKMKDATRTIRIVDFQTNPDAEREIRIALAKCHVDSDTVDWFKKDYGIVIVCQVRHNEAARLETLIGNIDGATY